MRNSCTIQSGFVFYIEKGKLREGKWRILGANVAGSPKKRRTVPSAKEQDKKK